VKKMCLDHAWWIFALGFCVLALYYLLWVKPAQGGIASPDQKIRGIPHAETVPSPQPPLLPSGKAVETLLRTTVPAPPAEPLFVPTATREPSLARLPVTVRWTYTPGPVTVDTAVISLKTNGGEYAPLATVRAEPPQYTYMTTQLGMRHCYRVVLYGGQGQQKPQPEACVDVPTATEVQAVQVTWQKPGDEVVTKEARGQ